MSALILFEGIDGSGKTTLIKHLASALAEDGHDVVVTREPGGTGSPKAEEVRRLILQRDTGDNFVPDAEMLLFYAARLQHLADTIVPALQAGKLVLCDRFEASTRTFQIHTRQGNEPLFTFLHQQVVARLEPLGVPCTYVHLDLDPELAAERMVAASRTKPDVFDGREASFHEKVREGYQVAQTALHHMFTHVTIDASKSPVEMVAETRAKLGL